MVGSFFQLAELVRLGAGTFLPKISSRSRSSTQNSPKIYIGFWPLLMPWCSCSRSVAQCGTGLPLHHSYFFSLLFTGLSNRFLGFFSLIFMSSA